MMKMVVSYQEEYVKNSRGVLLFTCRWIPRANSKALVFLCHAFGTDCSINMKEVGVTLAEVGYVVIGLDIQGHGRSKGCRCYHKNYQHIIDDYHHFFKSICAMNEYEGKARFIFGESTGGTAALHLHLRDSNFWNGAILIAPVCKVRAKKKSPPKMALDLMEKMEDIIPKWKIIPHEDFIEIAVKDPVKREAEKFRLKTSFELHRMIVASENSLKQVTMPFIVLHGSDDKVMDPEVSLALYKMATSTDKTMKLYQGMWHGLICGEPDQNVKIVFSDIISWLDQRSAATS